MTAPVYLYKTTERNDEAIRDGPSLRTERRMDRGWAQAWVAYHTVDSVIGRDKVTSS
jgi:hypothetical protein